MTGIDLSVVDWSRAQFALTAMYHWIFVPLTLGLSVLCAFFESIYVKTGKEEWKKIAKFWMTLFGINFAIGLATGIILEFEFGTNWSNYSWMVGDLFGAPLAIEGLLAFFLESTFFAVMFFGWNRVSKKFHLMSTWMVALGSNLSALWILVANAWMQHPVAMQFNPDRARFELKSFWDMALSPVAISKFVHTTSSGFLLASLFVVTVSSWYLLKKRHIKMAKRSIIIASVFGLLASGFVVMTGDESAFQDARFQPVKLAALAGLYKGEKKAGDVVLGVMNPSKKIGDNKNAFYLSIKVPWMLSLLANRKLDSFVPGIDDFVYGNKQENIMSATDKIKMGKLAINALASYKDAKEKNDKEKASAALSTFNKYEQYIGYGYLKNPTDIVPPVAISFYSFHIMVALGTLFPILFLIFLFYTMKGSIVEQKYVLMLGLIGVFLGWIAQEAGWVLAEVGRQPWTINGLLPVNVAVTNLSSGYIKTTFFTFLILFTLLLIAEIKIMLKQIKIGPEVD